MLEKLGTVHLELDRSPKAKGKDAPRVPAAIVKKERLVRFGATSDHDKPVLPPRVALGTPDQIRKYIVNRPTSRNWKPDERLPADQLLSDDQKLLIQQEIARNNVEDSTAAVCRRWRWPDWQRQRGFRRSGTSSGPNVADCRPPRTPHAACRRNGPPDQADDHHAANRRTCRSAESRL